MKHIYLYIILCIGFLVPNSILQQLHAQGDPLLSDSALNFSASSGFYEAPFDLVISTTDPTRHIIYTLDGSNPQNSPSAISGAASVAIRVDPNSSNGRTTTPAFIVRASTGKTGYFPSFSESRTFIFLESVKRQSHPGGDWPSGPVNDQIIDLDMDSRVVDASEYRDLIDAAFKDIPTISVITENVNLFDPETGIYVNAWGHGFEWERECAVELIQPDATEGFNVNAGLRIRGGWSRHPNFPKHSFRLFFREEYGDGKLYFPLFDEEGTDQYDKIDLRTAQNYAWSNGDSRNTMTREVFSRDSQGDMAQPYTRSRYYHLYLNGMYWGLFQTQERAEARFAAEYLGGKDEDYDVVKVNTEDWNYRIEATDGTLESWREIWDMLGKGFSQNGDYFKLEGKDEQGNPVKGAQVHIDIDNLIDYMITIFYTGNFDSPTSSFGNNKGPNNFMAIFNREDKSKGFTFYAHDAEHSLFSYVASPGEGLMEDRVNLAERSDNKQMIVYDFSAFHPQWLHHKLTANKEYRMRFADRAYRHFGGNGVFTPDEAINRFNKRVEQIDMAIIAESARWGDAKTWGGPPYTRNEHWLPELEKVTRDFFPVRNMIVVNQMKEADIYTSLRPPEMTMGSTVLYNGAYPVSGSTAIGMENLNALGIIAYTLDGSDPRAVGGAMSSNAKMTNGKTLQFEAGESAILKARVKDNDDWSALMDIRLLAEEADYSGLVVTEIHYHPTDSIIGIDTISGKDFEFIEFKNIKDQAINLSGLILDSAVYYPFPENEVLASKQFYVVASKPKEFYGRYGLIASGNYKRNLSNGGEEILLTDRSGNKVINFFYYDTPPWPETPDGFGPSLVSLVHNPTTNPADGAYWRASSYIGGSPFADDPIILNNDFSIQTDRNLELYPNPTSDLLYIKISGADYGDEISLRMYGIDGTMVYQTRMYGDLVLNMRGLNISSGVYILKLESAGQIFTRKIIYR